MPQVLGVTLQRKSPLRRTALKKKSKRVYKSPRCVYETPTGRRPCKRPQVHIERCITHAELYLDHLWGLRVRTEECVIPHGTPPFMFACDQRIQANHGYRREHKGTRWLLINGWSACAATNLWERFHKDEWQWWVEAQWGEAVTEEMRRLARGPAKVDHQAVLDALRAP